MHICFRADEAPKLIQYLESNHIPFSSGEIIWSADILQSDPHWPVISHFMNEYDLFIMPETIFTPEELSAAEWLSIRSEWRAGYPQPEGNFGYEEITYKKDHYCDCCSCGLEQIDCFRIKKAPKWGKRSFFQLNWVGDELFVSNRARQFLEQKNITGISFKEVTNKTGTEIFPDVQQMFIHNLLSKGIVENNASIKKSYVCPKCGSKKYIGSGVGMMQFHKEIFTNAPDVVKTAEIFGDGHYASRMILIRNHVYQILTENLLDSSLIFEPIELT